jgi:hypothetical protein
VQQTPVVVFHADCGTNQLNAAIACVPDSTQVKCSAAPAYALKGTHTASIQIIRINEITDKYFLFMVKTLLPKNFTT